MTAAVSIKRFLRRAGMVALGGALLGAGAVGQVLPPATVQYSSAEAHLQLHAMALPPDGGQPQVLFSESAQRFAAGPRTLRAARVAQGTAGSEQRELKVMPRMGPLAALATNASGQYALAVSDEEGLRFSLHAPGGQEVATAEPITDQVPIALFTGDDHYVLVANRGYFVFGFDGSLLQHVSAPGSAYVAAASWAGDRRCPLLSILVDQQSQSWKVLQHCVDAQGIVLHRSVPGSAQAQPSHLFWLDRARASRLQVVITAPSAEEDGRWVLLGCVLEGEGGCDAHLLAGIPSSPVLALRGLPVVALSDSAVALLAPTQDARAVWIGKYARQGGSARAARRWALPSANARSIALVEALSVARSDEHLWIALAYGQPDEPGESGRMAYRSAVAAHRLELAQLFAARR